MGSNCAKTVQQALKYAGKKSGDLGTEELTRNPFGSDIWSLFVERKIPNLIYDRIKKQNKGKVVRPR